MSHPLLTSTISPTTILTLAQAQVLAQLVVEPGLTTEQLKDRLCYTTEASVADVIQSLPDHIFRLNDAFFIRGYDVEIDCMRQEVTYWRRIVERLSDQLTQVNSHNRELEQTLRANT